MLKEGNELMTACDINQLRATTTKQATATKIRATTTKIHLAELI